MRESEMEGPMKLIKSKPIYISEIRRDSFCPRHIIMHHTSEVLLCKRI